jgi:DUF2934 family protein
MKSRKRLPKVAMKGPTSTSGNQSAGPTGPSLEEIRLRAYEIHVGRGRIDGRELDDWLQAEREVLESLRARHSD